MEKNRHRVKSVNILMGIRVRKVKSRCLHANLRSCECAQEGRQLDIRNNIEAILSLPITRFDLNFLIVKRASECAYDISAVDHIHIARMEPSSIAEIVSADKELDGTEPIRRIDQGEA
jgi:hypothetical protein